MKSLIRIKDVTKRTGLARSCIYERVAAGDFPAPVKIGPRAVAWVETEVDQWINERIERRATAR